MIKYYGTPITPQSVFFKYMAGKNVLIPWKRPENLYHAQQICNKILIDNSAYTFYRTGERPCWSHYFKWVSSLFRYDYFIIPDIIGDTIIHNRSLIRSCPVELRPRAIPVYHINLQNPGWLGTLMSDGYDYVAIGGSVGDFGIGSVKWHQEMNRLIDTIKYFHKKYGTKIHLLRCLNPKIFSRYPIHSGDSSVFAQNHRRDGPENILKRIEPIQAGTSYAQQTELFKERSYI